MDDRPHDRAPSSLPTILELDHVFEALAHPRRRYLLYTLVEEPEWSLDDLAAKIAAWEQDVPREALRAEDIDRVFIELYHSHIPQLVEDDIVAFDEATRTIRPAANAEQVLNILETAGGSTDSAQEHHARGGHDGGYT